MEQAGRGWFLTVAAILFGLLAISNFLKPVLANANTGFVFLGHRLSGIPNDILGPLFGVILVVYVIGIWQKRRFAMPLGWAYAAYVVANMILFSIRTTDKPPGPAFLIATLVVGLGVPIGAAVMLTVKRASLP
jgi:hypothetical protein